MRHLKEHLKITPLSLADAFRIETISLIVVAASGLALTSCAKTDLSDLETENRELRDELRDVREDVRALRKDTRELREKVELLPTPASSTVATPPVVATPPAGTDAGSPKPTVPGLPPKQGNVKISISSNPRGATVFLEDKILGKTPLLYQHPPSTTSLMLRVEKPGFRPRLMSVRPDEDIKLSVQLARQ